MCADLGFLVDGVLLLAVLLLLWVCVATDVATDWVTDVTDGTDVATDVATDWVADLMDVRDGTDC
ncbi:MAG TPA: hypothetical protein DEG47_17130 [Cyanobacteria bacterium UBA11148]|nr:hypothetical protein [Cyanobacteria bacterium UBA11148]